MNIKKLTLDHPKWNKFCLESDDCWFNHTIDWIEYTLEYGGKESELLSFYIEDKANNIVAICPLIRHQNKLNFSGDITPNPALKNNLSEKLSKILYKKLFSEIEFIANEYEISGCKIGLTPLAKKHQKLLNYNFLMKYNFENISLNTQIIDLQKDELTLWGEIKKSHRYEINKGRKLFKFLIINQNNPDLSSFKEFKKLHYFSAGRMTRSGRTWEMQYEWIQKGNGVLILASLDNLLVGGIYTILYKDGGLYAISANHPDFDIKYPISHAIQWEMIRWLKKNRYKYYELGLQQFSDQPYDHPEEKDINISLFKRHFGGYTTTFYRGLKKY